MLHCSIREFVMGTTKKPRLPNVSPTGKAPVKKPVSVKTRASKAAAVATFVADPEPMAAPELTAADLAPFEAPEISEPIIEQPENRALTLPETDDADVVSIDVVDATPTAEGVEQKGTEIMNDVIENTKKFAEEAKTRFESAFAEMSEKTKVGVEKSSKVFEEFSDLAKGNVEAIVESGKIATKGVETLGQDAAEYGRVTFEKASAALKSLAAAKTPAEFFQLQSELLSSTFDAFAKEAAKNSEAMLKLASEVAQPISTRVSLISEKVRSIAA